MSQVVMDAPTSHIQLMSELYKANVNNVKNVAEKLKITDIESKSKFYIINRIAKELQKQLLTVEDEEKSHFLHDFIELIVDIPPPLEQPKVKPKAAGERGPSWTETSQMNSWKVIHVRFIETSDSQLCDVKREVNPKQQWKSQGTPKKTVPSMSSKVAASVPLSAMLQLGKLIQPTEEIVTVQLEEFKMSEKSWAQPFEVTLSLSKTKFSSGSFRDAYIATPLSGLSPGKYVLKKFKEDQVHEIENLFKSIEEHTRKVVQMNALARNFALTLSNQAPVEYGPVLSYTKVYFGWLYGEFVTLENYLEGDFQKYVNNTGDV
ncbi:hypothetical protein AC249_AIPGENE13528 [Exaiptasia diaphana]|nr:hypothetical protein AC249_AIPGENE13528 [Exaiptasia diaphana]